MPPNSELYGVRLQAQLAAARASAQTELAAVQATHRGEIEAIKTKHDQESARLLGEVSLYSRILICQYLACTRSLRTLNLV